MPAGIGVVVVSIRRAAVVRPLIAVLLSAWLGSAAAQPPDVMLQGVLGDKALLRIEGRRTLLGVGETSPQGVRVDRVEADAVHFTLDGEQYRVELGGPIRGKYVERERKVARVYPDTRGMYVAVGSINGFPVEMLLDTGATYVGLDASTALNLGVEYRLEGRPTRVNTAAGEARAMEVILDSVSLGEITINDVTALVIEGAGPGIPLLGMSFLRRLDVSTQQGAMVLEQRR